MSSVFVEGVGYVSIDSNKSEAQKQATIKYYKEVAPKYKGMGGFWAGDADIKSQIYRWGQKLSGTEDEEKNRWFQEQVEEWGNMIGVYDSIALAKYYEDIAKEGELTKGEQADAEANMAVLNEFKKDMYFAYDNNEKDISQVQQKYGYEPEELSVLEGLGAFYDMATTNPMYTLGSLFGMLRKDPQYLLLSYLRIPKMASGMTTTAVNMAAKASMMQPKYVQKVGRFMQNSRVQAGVGRGVEGATYGGVYEALHDLTFKGYIDPQNVKRGLALGALVGTAFGGIAGSIGNKSWMVSKVSSEQAAQRLAKPKAGQSKGEPKGDRTQPTILDNVNKNYRPETVSLLPDGLSHTARAKLWFNRSIQIRQDAWLKKNPKESIKNSRVRQEHRQDILKERKELGKLKNKDGSKLFSKAQIKGLAEKNVAQRLEHEHNINFKKEGVKKHNDPSWGNRREVAQGKKDLKDGVVIRERDTHTDIFNNADAIPKKATAKQIAAYAAGGAALGAYIASEDKQLGGLIGMVAGGVLRRQLKGLDANQARLKMKFYSAADNAGISRRLSELYTGKTMATLKSVLMGKNPKMSHEVFLDHIEFYSKPEYAKLRESLPLEVRVGIDAVRELMRKFKADAKKYGILKNEQFINDYIAHIFGNKPPKGKNLRNIQERLGNVLDTTSSNAMPRKLHKTISQIVKEFPEYNIETDVFKILDGYSRSMTKAITGAELVKEITAVGVLEGKQTIGLVLTEGANKAMDILAKKLGYKSVNQPALKGKLVHPLMAKSFEDFFFTPVGSNLILNKAITVTNALKRIAVTWSFFHAQSLILSAAYAGAGVIGAVTGLSKTGRARMNRVRELMNGQWEQNPVKYNKHGEIIETTNNMLPEQVYGDFLHRQTLKELAEHGIGVAVKANEFIDAGYSTMKTILDKIPVVGEVQTGIDKITWDILHDHLKIFTYLTVKERAMSGTPKGLGRIIPKKYLEGGKWKGLNEYEAGQIAGKYVNNAFGGQSHTKLALEWQAKAIENINNPKGEIYQWMALATAPSKARLSNLVLFSPDWTVSNIRIAFRGMGMTKDLVSKVARGGKLTTKELAEWNMYAGYMTRGFIITSFGAYVLHSWLADEGHEFDLADFWLTGRLQLGGGEEMVVSKQIAEPIHWLMHPMNTAWNKSSTFPKTIAEIFMGKEYISLKHGNWRGPSMDLTKPKDIVKYGVSKITPISGNPFRRWLWEGNYATADMIKHTLAGMSGFPFYGRKN
jgi:hypothetical protein